MPTLASAANVAAIAFAASGTRLIGACADGMIRHWDPKSPEALKAVQGDKARHRQLTFSRDGGLLAGVAGDGKIKIWNANSGALLHTLPGHALPGPALPGKNAITRSLGFSRDAKLLASGGDDKLTVVWDVQTGTRKWSAPSGIGEARAFVFSPDGASLFSPNSDTDVRFWRAANGELERKLEEFPLAMFAADYSNDGRWLAIAGADSNIYIWSVREAKLVRTLTGHPDPIVGVRFSPDGKSLLTSGLDEASGRNPAPLSLWSIESGKSRLIERAASSTTQIYFSPDGDSVAWTCFGKQVEIRQL